MDAKMEQKVSILNLRLIIQRLSYLRSKMALEDPFFFGTCLWENAEVLGHNPDEQCPRPNNRL